MNETSTTNTNTNTNTDGNFSPEEEEKIGAIKTQALKKATIWVGKPTVPFESDFEKLNQLGQAGQYGITFRCRHRTKKETYAVKILSKNRFYRIPPENRHRYLSAMHDEIAILSTLRHPNIIRLHSIYEDKPYLYLVMEECTGGELLKRIIARSRYNEADAAKVMKQILSALKYMHEEHNIVHCDLKPDNILFLSPKEDSLLKIIDFGMSKVLPRLQFLTHLCGTPYYTAPEVIDQKKYNHQADMWSVGVILFVMLFGYPPFFVDPQKYGRYEQKAIYEKIKKGFQNKIVDTKTKGVGPWFPNDIPVSSAARDLIVQLLQKEVNKRYSAHEALTHPWILNEGAESHEKATIPKEMLTTLAKFSNTCEFKLVIIKLFRKEFEFLRPHHFKQLEDIFEKMDTDKDGVVSLEEFEKAICEIPSLPISSKEIKSMFQELNVSNIKAGIRFDDLLNAVVHDYLVACDERLYAAFSELDTDDDGFITVEELKAKLKECDPLGELDRACQLIEEQSLESDGRIDYEEFLIALHPKFDEPPIWLPDLHQMRSLKSFKIELDDTNSKEKNKSSKSSKSSKTEKSSHQTHTSEKPPKS